MFDMYAVFIRSNTAIFFDHIGAPPNLEMWPIFHNTVSAGLTVIPGLPHVRVALSQVAEKGDRQAH